MRNMTMTHGGKGQKKITMEWTEKVVLSTTWLLPVLDVEGCGVIDGPVASRKHYPEEPRAEVGITDRGGRTGRDMASEGRPFNLICSISPTGWAAAGPGDADLA